VDVHLGRRSRPEHDHEGVRRPRRRRAVRVPGARPWWGTSLSTFDAERGWRQTWVDSTGNYWALHGEPHAEGFSFVVEEVEEGRDVIKRMVFSDVAPDAFLWRWERSQDAGHTWELRWAIDYRRAESAPSLDPGA
jgi:hypothetical protein